MPNYMINATYSAGSWARLIRLADDRVKAVGALMASLGGSVVDVYWEVSGRAVHAVVQLPDSAGATAVAGVLSQSGAFRDVGVQEVLTHDQFTGVLKLAESVAGVYKVPGQAVLEDQSSQ